MKLIVGLGNPGSAYVGTRHNAGFLVADRLQSQKLPKDIIVKKSNVFMNDSGSFVKSLTIRYSLSPNDLFIVHDDLDITLGEYKIQYGRGPKDHNGIGDIEGKLGTKDFWRVRIGVDPTSREATRGEVLVLGNFTNEERVILDKVVKVVTKELFEKIKSQ
jgi:PTH1 family peptidyl-tRNA hydrolase